LIAWRSLQGAALGAGVMCARAVVRDLYAPHMGAQVMSKALTGLGVLAFLAPISGSLLVGWLGWRSTMLAQAFMGCLAWLLVVLRFRESIPQRNPQALHPKHAAAVVCAAGPFGGCSIRGLRPAVPRRPARGVGRRRDRHLARRPFVD
jgi:MFS family permease